VQTKLNFWQWLGIVFLLGGIVWYAYDKWIKPEATPASPAQPAPAGPTGPTTTPVITSQPSR
jgi:hypothetical protein